jgi:hypothetical protein
MGAGTNRFTVSCCLPHPHPTVGIGRSAQHLPLYLRLCTVSSLHVTMSALKRVKFQISSFCVTFTPVDLYYRTNNMCLFACSNDAAGDFLPHFCVHLLLVENQQFLTYAYQFSVSEDVKNGGKIPQAYENL